MEPCIRDPPTTRQVTVLGRVGDLDYRELKNKGKASASSTANLIKTLPHALVQPLRETGSMDGSRMYVDPRAGDSTPRWTPADTRACTKNRRVAAALFITAPHWKQPRLAISAEANNCCAPHRGVALSGESGQATRVLHHTAEPRGQTSAD